MERLWMRLGDAGEYEQYGDDFDAVANVLAEVCYVEGFGVGGYLRGDEIERGGGAASYGIIIPGHFEGCNYVSLYWGDNDADAVRELTDDELDALRRAVNRLARDNTYRALRGH